MSDISMGIHPRQQSARKQFTNEQVKYFYNSNIFADRPTQYEPAQFQRNQILKETKNIKPTYSPQLSPRIIKIDQQIKTTIETDIITGQPINSERSVIQKNNIISKTKSIKTETSECNSQFDTKSQSRTQISPQKFTNLFFDNKKQYELWMKQNKNYENINYFDKNQDLTQSRQQNYPNSYLQIHGKKQIQNSEQMSHSKIQRMK